MEVVIWKRSGDEKEIFYSLVIIFSILFFIYVFFFWNKADGVFVEPLPNESDYSVYSGRNVYEWWKNTLTEKEQILYDEMKESYLQFKSDFSTKLDELTFNEMENVRVALLLDHPEMFWANLNQTNLQRNDYKINVKKKIELSYAYTEEEAIAIKTRIEPVYMEIVNGAKKQKNDYRKIKYVHDKLIKTTEFEKISDENGRLDQSIVTIFDEHKSVCAGYAYGFKFIMDQLDIDTVVIRELVAEGAKYDHVWNMVNLYKEWYNIDVTYDKQKSTTSIVSDEYFLRNDSEFYLNHSIKKNIPQI